jgi:catechol 2,3-dioxygenase
MMLPADTRIANVTLVVSDLERSRAFYQDILGFSTLTADGAEARLGTRDGRQLLKLVERRGARPRPARTSGLFHVAILVPDRAALGRSLRRLTTTSWPLSGAADHIVSEALYLSDPDGLGLEFYRDRPKATWPREGDEIIMATDPLNLDDLAREPGAASPWTGLDESSTVGHVHLHVPDLDSAEAFYCGRIGFSPTLRRYPGALFVAAPGYHHHVGLNIWAGRGAPPPPDDVVGLSAFTVEGTGVEERDNEDHATRVVVRVRGR